MDHVWNILPRRGVWVYARQHDHRIFVRDGIYLLILVDRIVYGHYG